MRSDEAMRAGRRGWGIWSPRRPGRPPGPGPLGGGGLAAEDAGGRGGRPPPADLVGDVAERHRSLGRREARGGWWSVVLGEAGQERGPEGLGIADGGDAGGESSCEVGEHRREVGGG